MTTSKKFQHKRDERIKLNNVLKQHASDILSSDNFRKTSKHLQHGNVSVKQHCLDVARNSVALNRKFRLGCEEKELVRGALLHDYFLYDWHDADCEDCVSWHGFFHPGIALKNALKEYRLTTKEQDIIKKHMWPMTFVPPKYKEGWVVTLVDKYCSTLETLRIRKGNISAEQVKKASTSWIPIIKDLNKDNRNKNS